MKKTILLLICAGTCLTAHSAVITFSSQTFRQTNESTPADTTWVTTAGTLYGAKNIGGVTTTVNGVTFTGVSGSSVNGGNGALSQPNVAWSIAVGSSFFSEGGGNSANNFLDSGGYNSGAQALQFSSLTVGNTYAVDMVFADTRAALNGRYVNVSGTVVSGVTLTDYGIGITNQQYAFGTGDAGFLVIKATFVADTVTQDFSIRGFNANATNSGGQLNAFQIRNLGVVPEPCTSLLGGFGMLALLQRRRRDR
ncbi:PEP-CTERM sorting domain-containing protein [Luteolibacter arcticus]|uniref:PEP-CTERM sorting domain-containing protein n=1 Tax=Luteolibacter arcticus TaxID=1581411 RepID=A0ABT3GQ95_9BACT|nr:PEP-CTERM sorting domain-containing protein [Luteolibacter arcticus]MCW1925686.1 PEP-CTERM sorting domain-containing protein [Luteolibacter arcticus]